MTLAEARVVVEGLIFAAERPLSAKEIAEIVDLDKPTVEALVEDIRRDYARSTHHPPGGRRLPDSNQARVGALG